MQEAAPSVPTVRGSVVTTGRLLSVRFWAELFRGAYYRGTVGRERLLELDVPLTGLRLSHGHRLTLQ